MRLFIVTGASAGLGAQIVDDLVARGELVIAVTHRGAPRSPDTPSQGKRSEKEITCDLMDLDDVDHLVHALASAADDQFEEIVFISNAGVIKPIGKVGSLGDSLAIAHHITVNFTAPAALVNGLVAALSGRARLEVVNITSGAARRSIPGWSLYCSSKAAFRAFLDVASLENADLTVVHIDPGVMDTGMQETIRGASHAEFPAVEQFRDYERSGRLRPVSEVSRDVLERYLVR